MKRLLILLLLCFVSCDMHIPYPITIEAKELKSNGIYKYTLETNEDGQNWPGQNAYFYTYDEFDVGDTLR
jgi:hypothetical protein